MHHTRLFLCVLFDTAAACLPVHRIRVPGSLSCSGDRNRSNSLARRRAAIDISPRAVQQLSDKVAALDAGHLDVGSGGVTRCEVEALYSDMQLIHRGR